MPVGLDGATTRRWCSLLEAALIRHRTALDALNVFPVPDRDTGTNVLATIRSAAVSVAACPDDGVGDVWAAMATGAALGAHGNSGGILAEWLRGSSSACAGMTTCDAGSLVKALLLGSDAARAAVAAPVEGTILGVARAAAEAAAGADTSVPEALDAAVRAGEAALAASEQLVPALRDAGVVDAGGAALLITLSALRAAVAGDDGLVDLAAKLGPRSPMVPAAALRPADIISTGGAPSKLAYEVQFLIYATEDELKALRTRLPSVGDSLVVAGDGAGKWNVHIHTDDPHAVLAEASAAGTALGVRVTEIASVTRPSGRAAKPPSVPRSTVALLAEAALSGISDVLRNEGVQLVATDSTDAWRQALDSVDAPAAVLFPITATAQAAATDAAAGARAGGQQVAVIAVRSVVQALAAVAVHDVTRRFQDDVAAMSAAAAATRGGSVSATASGVVQGFVDTDVVATGTDVAAVAQAVVDRLLESGGELVTLVGGIGASLDAVTARLRRRDVEVVAYLGGQRDPLVLMGVE